MKYIIELEDEPMVANSSHQEVDELWKAKGFNSLVFDQNGIKKLTPYTEPDRKAIEDAQEEAWEFAKQVTIMTPDDKCELWGTSKYNTINLGYSYAEAKAKYEAWKVEREQIRVGDEVEYECGSIVRFVVTGFCGETAFGFKHQCDYDDVGEYCDIEDLRKTGRHFSEIEELLKKMRGVE